MRLFKLILTLAGNSYKVRPSIFNSKLSEDGLVCGTALHMNSKF